MSTTREQRIDALENSIAHWTEDIKKLKLFGGDYSFGSVFDSDNCALCQIFTNKENTCKNCPISKGENYGCGNGTAYSKTHDAHYDRDKKAFLKARADMLLEMNQALDKELLSEEEDNARPDFPPTEKMVLNGVQYRVKKENEQPAFRKVKNNEYFFESGGHGKILQLKDSQGVNNVGYFPGDPHNYGSKRYILEAEPRPAMPAPHELYLNGKQYRVKTENGVYAFRKRKAGECYWKNCAGGVADKNFCDPTPYYHSGDTEYREKRWILEEIKPEYVPFTVETFPKPFPVLKWNNDIEYSTTNINRNGITVLVLTKEEIDSVYYNWEKLLEHAKWYNPETKTWDICGVMPGNEKVR